MAQLLGSSDDRDIRQRFLAKRSALWNARSSFDSHWRELADQFLPRRARFESTDRNRGGGRNQNIYDSTGRFSVRTLQSGLHAGLTSPARPWLNLTVPDPELAELPPVQDWLHTVTKRIRAVLARTNVYQSLPLLYGDLGVFGTAAMGVVNDDRELFRTYVYPIGSYAIGLDKRRMVTTFVHEYELTVRQVVEEFGLLNGGKDIDWTLFSSHVKRAWEHGDYENPVTIVWVVCPNTERRRDRLDARYSMPWASYHFELTGDSKGALRSSGFNEFPVMVPRWDVTGEDAYGTDCPGMTALPDSKQLQVMQRYKGRAIAKMVDPPLKGPTSLIHQATSLLPAAMTYVDVRDGMQGLEPIHEVRLDLSHLSDDTGQTQYRIQRAFFEDLFLMLATADQNRGTQPPTAEEVRERHEEKLLALGPVMNRTDHELLNPMVDRVYAMMERAGLIPEPPEELDGVPLTVEYTSIMAQAQKLVGVAGQDRFLQTMIPIIEAAPETIHKIDFNRIIDNYGEMLGVDPHIIRSDEEADELADGARQQQATMANAQSAALLGRAAKDAAAAPIDTPSALTAALEAAS